MISAQAVRKSKQIQSAPDTLSACIFPVVSIHWRTKLTKRLPNKTIIDLIISSELQTITQDELDSKVLKQNSSVNLFNEDSENNSMTVIKNVD